MSLSINKRLKYFDTEEEYEQFLEEQRASADAGTLELLETTVCCITHGNTETPDTYLPSHDIGDEDKLMHYNATDEIRYVPFINPMWTSENRVSLIPISSGGYRPKINTTKYLTLPNVIDGKQITLLDKDFLSKITSFPVFNNSNVKEINATSYYNNSLTLPSYWKSLITCNIQHTYIKFTDNILNASNLVTFKETWSNLRAPTVLTSDNLKSYTLDYNISNTEGLSLDLNTIIPNSENLELLSLGYGVLHNINFTYSGSNTLKIGQLRLGSANYPDNVHVDIAHPNGSIINTNNIFYNCNLFNSSCNVCSQSTYIFEASCTGEGQNNMTVFNDDISYSNTKLSVIFPNAEGNNYGNITLSKPQFYNIEVTQRGIHKPFNLKASAHSNSDILTINLFGDDSNTLSGTYISIDSSTSSEFRYSKVVLNNVGEVGNHINLRSLSVLADKISFDGIRFDSNLNNKLNWNNYTCDIKSNYYLSSVFGDVSVSGALANLGILHGLCHIYNINTDVEQLDAVFEYDAYTRSSYSLAFRTTLNANVNSYNIINNLTENIKRNTLELYCINTEDVSLDTVKKTLLLFSNFLNIPKESASKLSTVTLAKEFVDALPQEYLDIFYSFENHIIYIKET